MCKKFKTLAKQSSDNQDPLYRLFSRECTIGKKLLDQVRKDLADVVKVCEGVLKQTNHLRTLMSCLTKGSFRSFSRHVLADQIIAGTIPTHWRRYKVNKAMAISEWIPNLARRLEQLDNISGLDNLSNVEVWLGGLFFPEAYITATRQAVAHRKRWSLETLHLRLDIERVNDPGAFVIDGKQ
jgi:dynein heavy chain 1